MRCLPLACATVFLAACSLTPNPPTEVPPAPIVEGGSGAVIPAMRDVSEDGPQTASAAVLVMNSSSSTDGSGMVMWPPSFASSSSWSGSGVTVSSAISASGATVSSTMSGSGTVVTASSSVAGSGGLVMAPRQSSSSSLSIASVSSQVSSSSDVSVSSMAQGESPLAPASSSNGAVGGGGVQPRRVANNLVISIETDYEAVPPGGLVQLSIPVRNFSVGAAEGFLVEAVVPEGATIVDAVLGEIDGRSVRWRFNQLLENQMYTLHYAVRLPRAAASNTQLPFSARVSGGNLAGTALVTTNVTIQKDLPQTGVDLGATILGEARSSAAGGQRMAIIVAALTAVALAVGLIGGRVLASQRH